MTRRNFLSKPKLALGVISLVIVVAQPAFAQYYDYNYYCPPGYALRVGYGCMPLSYFYGPPTYAYPGFGFRFFYGPSFRYHSFHHGHPLGHRVHPGSRAGHPGHGAHPSHN
jgi:hypothetical protein